MLLSNHALIKQKQKITMYYVYFQTTGKCGEYEELETHLKEATKRFDQVLDSSDDSLVQNVPEMYLEPIRLDVCES